MPKKDQLTDRYRDSGGKIRQKHRDTGVGSLPKASASSFASRHSNATVATLRKVYGSDFAKGFRSDVKLSSILSSTGAESLAEYLEHSERAKALSKSTGTSELSNTIISVSSTVFAPALKNLAKK
jgi:hypothetical protein